MADFISSLNGNQMDAALMDMAEHNSEAYAVGERNGVAVGTDDVTYHNNARYYAQQAQSIAPASVTEAVRWDIDQTALTDANKEMARANIDAGKNGAWSNDNLLDNPFYTINQCSFSSMADGTSGYTVDRWKKGTRGSASKLTNGVRLSTSSTELWFTQVLPSDLVTALVGETVTLSVKCANLSGTWRLGGLGNNTRGNPTEGIFSVTFTVSSASNTEINISTTSTGSIDVLAVKLEKGTVSTLANDVPPDSGTELLKCQQYFFRVTTAGAYSVVGNGFATSTSATSILIPTPITMRATPTVAVTNVGSIQLIGNGAARIVTSVSIRDKTQNGVLINATVSGSNLTASQAYSLAFADTSPILDFSADLQ